MHEEVLDRVLQEINDEGTLSCDHDLGTPDLNRLTDNAFLQSVYAETLRLHVATLITRIAKKAHTVDSCLLQKGQIVMVSSNIEHFNPQWDSIDRPAAGFHPDRFLKQLDDHNQEVKFSLEGRQGQWIPFGFGEHLCPGRHFAKQEMIINAVVMLRMFEFQLLTPKGWRPSNDFKRYGLGTQQPKEQVPFRVRRR